MLSPNSIFDGATQKSLADFLGILTKNSPGLISILTKGVRHQGSVVTLALGIITFLLAFFPLWIWVAVSPDCGERWWLSLLTRPLFFQRHKIS
jgi:hypothetical protein